MRSNLLPDDDPPPAPKWYPTVPAPPKIRNEAARLWATGRYVVHRDEEHQHFQIRPKGVPGRREGCLWLEAVGDERGPAVSVVACRARRWIHAGTVTCQIGDRQYTLIPSFAFWDQEEQPDGGFETLTFSNFGVPETREAFEAIIGQDQPVMVCMAGGDDRFEFEVTTDDLQQLRDMLVLYRERGGNW